MTLFDMGTDEPTIWKNRDVLKDTYQPDQILGRDEQKRALFNALSPVLEGTGNPDNVFISGPPGTGKTVLTRSAADQINGDDDLDIRVVWQNCEVSNGETSLMLHIANCFRPIGNKLSVTGYSEEQAVNAMFEEIEGCDSDTVIIALDELDSVGSLDKFLYYMSRPREFGVTTNLGLISISNDPDFISELPDKVQSTLNDTHITFPSYEADEISEVLKHRATLAFRDTELVEVEGNNREVSGPTIENGAVEYAAAMGAKSSGDMRMARDVLRKAGDSASHANESTVTFDHVKEAVNSYHANRMTATIESFDWTTKAVLYALTSLVTDGSDNPRTAEVYQRYRSLLSESGHDPVGKRTVERHLTKFSDVNLTETVKHGGKGGYYKEHTLKYEPETVTDGLGEVIDVLGVHRSVADLENLETEQLAAADD